MARKTSSITRAPQASALTVLSAEPPTTGLPASAGGNDWMRRALQTEHALRERVKELECLYTISSLRELHSHSADLFLQGAVDCLPRTWQFPEYASARIVCGTSRYMNEGFREDCPWRMAAEVRNEGKPVGVVEIFYAKGVPVSPDGPFLKEEHALLRVIAERVGSVLAQIETENELHEAHAALRHQHQTLQETNITLRTVLSRLEEEKREIRASILANIQKLIMPIVFELELAVTGRQRSYVTLLRQTLQEIAAPFLTQLTRNHVELTPVEVAIAAMIRNGLSTKDIAQLRCITPSTVRRHRENIRRKLGLQNRRANLVTYLQGEASPEPLAEEAPSNRALPAVPGPHQTGPVLPEGGRHRPSSGGVRP